MLYLLSYRKAYLLSSTPCSPLYSKDETLKWMSQSVFAVPYQYLSAGADWPPSPAAGETHGAHCTRFSLWFAVITLLITCPQCRYYELLHIVNDLCHFAFLLSERTLNSQDVGGSTRPVDFLWSFAREKPRQLERCKIRNIFIYYMVDWTKHWRRPHQMNPRITVVCEKPIKRSTRGLLYTQATA